jgi:hypothetical protein
VEHSDVRYDGSSHDTREQQSSEHAFAWDEEQECTEHFKRSGDVSEPLTDADRVKAMSR